MTVFCAAVDWGTTNLRLWLINHEGHVAAGVKTDEGLRAISNHGFEAVLDRHLAALGAPAGVPVVVCGMAGARSGWVEAPYLNAPTNLTELWRHAAPVPSTAREIVILPGVSQDDLEAPDVMRGEETQLLGAIDGGATTGLFCLPGTHSKWVELQAGLLKTFRTCLTGELFDLLSHHSILSGFIDGTAPDVATAADFSSAVDTMLGEPEFLIEQLFSIRAKRLLGLAERADATAELSGLLIGSEIAAMRARFGNSRPITLIAAGGVADAYQKAFDRAGITVRRLDPEAVVLAGLFHAASHLWPGAGRKAEPA